MLATKDVIPSAYVVRTTYTRCTNCNCVGTSSEFLAMSFIKARNAIGEPVRHYEPVSRPQYNLPITHTAAPPRLTAFCVRCTPRDLSHLPPPPSASMLYDLTEPLLKDGRSANTGAKAPVKSPAAKKPNIQDLA
jgi:hypothetical protein